MKYTVSINEKSKTITVILADGTKGVAKCCDTDQFNLATGIELALERAKVAKKEAEAAKSPITKSGDVMELVKALEKALPKGQVVIVGNGNGLTAQQKAWLHSLTDCDGCCDCDCLTDEEIEDIKTEAHNDGYNEGYDDGYNEGYDDGYADGVDEAEETNVDIDELRNKIENILENLG